MVAWRTNNGSVAVLGGVRTPFSKAGTDMRQLALTDLARAVMRETLHRVGWPAGRVDEVVLGNVVMPADAANPARVAAVQAGVPAQVPALTLQRNCASGMEAVAYAASSIHTGQAQIVLAVGAESMSNIPILFPEETLEPMARLAKAKTWSQKLGALAAFRPRHFRPVPAIVQGLTDPLCGLIMGKTAEVLAQEFSITRRDQDEFALESHRRAARAVEQRHGGDHVVTVYVGDHFDPVTADNGPRPNQTMEALARLRPVFDRRDGTVTVGNSCQITDGAAAVLIADEEVARAQGLEVLGHIRAYATTAHDPMRMGLGPVHAIAQVLRMTGLTLGDIELFEINEAFAAQVLACIRAMGSDSFCREQLGHGPALGDLPLERLNVNGGAIALGHPVGATGARIVLDLLMEMRRRDLSLGIASLCVAGGQGTAILLERN